MPWTPESTDPLSAVLSGNAIEATAMQLMREFLSGYFSGSTHSERAFPLAEIICQNGPAIKEGLTLQVIFNGEQGKPSRMWEGGERIIYTSASWSMILRAVARSPRQDLHNSQSLCRWGSDALYSLLNDETACKPLATAGILLVRPEVPRLGPTLEFSASRALGLKTWLAYSTSPPQPAED